MQTPTKQHNKWYARVRCLVGVFFVIAYVTANATSAFAMAPLTPKDPVADARSSHDVLYSGDCETTTSAAHQSGSGSPSASPSGAGANCEAKPLPEAVPECWRTLIDETAKQYPDVDRRTVAAELWVENRGWPDCSKTQWTASQGAQAAGPWQFIPSTWAIMGTDGDGDGIASPDNPKDAVHAAFKHNKGTACKPILEGATGNAQADYENVPFNRNDNTLMSSIAKYNGSGTQDGVAIGQQGRGQNPDYVKMAYWLIATDFKQSIDVETGEMIDATSAGAAANGGSASNSNVNAATGNQGAAASCQNKSAAASSTSTGNGSSTGQFANPLPTGQLTECYDGRGGSHKAIDISDVSGTGAGGPALASDGGVVTMVDDGDYGGFGKTVIVKHENGYYTRYSHLDSISVKQGDKVAKGDKVGLTGNTGRSHGTHLDFGISKNPGVPNDGSAEDPLKFIDKSTIREASQCA